MSIFQTDLIGKHDFRTHDQMKCSPKSQDRALYESLLKQAWSAWRTETDI